MKTLLSCLLCLIMCGAVLTDKAPALKWNKTEHHFGQVQQDSVLETVFTCYNTADSPVVIENIVSSCGCTVADWCRTPIAKGDSCVVKTRFNTSGKRGKHSKYFAVYTSTGMTELLLTADIRR